MIDIDRTLRLLDVEAESNFVQAEAIDAINYLLRENARYKLTQAKYVEVIDRMNGTPCEQIRHQQEVEALREENARLRAERDKAVEEMWKASDQAQAFRKMVEERKA